ncbi:TraB/GumN family protein [Candidatus Woesearchaeota archaeon]|nr:TraB/GumN family protein [Candidatus Woesearchaeota archaeon]
MRYKNLVFLGTSHIAKQSLDEVKKAIEGEKPDIVALELDRKRMVALMQEGPRKIDWKNIGRVGLKGFLFSLFGAWAEKKLGKLVGVAPGSEMRQAIRIAKKSGIKIALVDQDIEITLQRLTGAFTLKEKWNFFADIFKALFKRKMELEFDLATVPDKKVIKKLTSRLKERYPSLYRVLIGERNLAIAENIASLMDSSQNKKILVILGAGHVEEVLDLIKKKEGSISFSFRVG